MLYDLRPHPLFSNGHILSCLYCCHSHFISCNSGEYSIIVLLFWTKIAQILENVMHQAIYLGKSATAPVKFAIRSSVYEDDAMIHVSTFLILFVGGNSIGLALT